MANQKNDQPVNTDTEIQVTPGLPLVDKNGNYIGKVKAAQKDTILVDRSILHYHDLRVPYHVILNTAADQIKLDITEREIDQQGW